MCGRDARKLGLALAILSGKRSGAGSANANAGPCYGRRSDAA
jgi:hypothetical protein